MDGQHVLFEFLWVKWTVPLLATAVAGTITAIATTYKLYERWVTREQRRLEMLHTYIDKEEQDISARRRRILRGIQQTTEGYRSEKKFDVGAEIDEALELLNRDKPQRAFGRLLELEKKLVENITLLEKRVDDLHGHASSTRVFLAVLAHADGRRDVARDYVRLALQHNPRDLDALQLQGQLHFEDGELAESARLFERLRLYSNGSAAFRTEAYLGLARICLHEGDVTGAAQKIGTALQNFQQTPTEEQNPLTHALALECHGEIARAQQDTSTAISLWQKALAVLAGLPASSRSTARQRHLEGLIGNA